MTIPDGDDVFAAAEKKAAQCHVAAKHGSVELARLLARECSKLREKCKQVLEQKARTQADVEARGDKVSSQGLGNEDDYVEIEQDAGSVSVISQPEMVALEQDGWDVLETI